MKKHLFSLAIFASMIAVNAQTVIWSDNFDDEDLSDWTILDEDGDGYEWETVVLEGLSPAIASYSYDNATFTPLTPDNWIISPAIDLSGVSGSTLKYLVKTQDPSWPNETYSVYVSTDFSFNGVEPLLTENAATNGVGGVFYDKEIDISDFDGESTVYVAFRHHDSNDMFSLHIDDVSIEGEETAAVTDLNGAKSAIYPNPVVDTFNVEVSSKFNANNLSVTVTDMTGKVVKTFGAASSYNVSDLAAGVYVVKITDGKNTDTKKIVKK